MTNEPDIRVVIAELRSDLKHFSGVLENVREKLDNMPTMRDYTELEKRLSRAEANQSKAAWAIIGSWIAGIGVVINMMMGKQ